MNAEKKLALIKEAIKTTMEYVPFGADSTSVWFGLVLAITAILNQPD